VVKPVLCLLTIDQLVHELQMAIELSCTYLWGVFVGCRLINFYPQSSNHWWSNSLVICLKIDKFYSTQLHFQSQWSHSRTSFCGSPMLSISWMSWHWKESPSIMHLWKKDRRSIALIPCFQRYDNH
jgi:hypothetical protein